MDELEWLKANSPPARPSPDTTRGHRTQLRAAIASEGADGSQPQRRRPRRHPSRHRVLTSTAVVAVLCIGGATVVALVAGGDGGSKRSVESPAARTPPAPLSTAPFACTGPGPASLAVPAGFGPAQAIPAAQADTAPAPTQQVTSWKSDRVTIELRWPADAARDPWADQPQSSADGFSGVAEGGVTTDKDGVSHRTLFFLFPNQPKGCHTVQVTVYGTDRGQVGTVSEELNNAPFKSTTPLVTGTRAGAVPSVVICDVPRGVAAPATRTGGALDTGASDPTSALAMFVVKRRDLPRLGYQSLDEPDGSIVYVNEPRPSVVVTTVHVVPSTTGWIVHDWEASGC